MLFQIQSEILAMQKLEKITNEEVKTFGKVLWWHKSNNIFHPCHIPYNELDKKCIQWFLKVQESQLYHS